MKKLVILVLSLLIPYFAVAGTPADTQINWYQEQCAKEPDPIKRHKYCHVLDQYSQSETTNTIDSFAEIVVA